jgi:hypothetical protein
MKDELHGGCFLKKIKLTFVSLKKIETKIPGVDNVELYQCAKFWFKYRCCFKLHKNNTSDNFFKVWKHTLLLSSRSMHLSFLLKLKYNEFGFGILHTSRSQNYLCLDFFKKNWKFFNTISKKNSKKWATCSLGTICPCYVYPSIYLFWRKFHRSINNHQQKYKEV